MSSHLSNRGSMMHQRKPDKDKVAVSLENSRADTAESTVAAGGGRVKHTRRETSNVMPVADHSDAPLQNNNKADGKRERSSSRS